MAIKFPNWDSIYGNNLYDEETSALTPQAKDWLEELTGVNDEQLKHGLRTMSERKNPAFPPTSSEFSRMCKLYGWEDAMDEICLYLQGEKGFYWTNVAAYNIFLKLRINRNTNTDSIGKIAKKAEDLFIKMKSEEMVDIPPPLPKKQEVKNSRDDANKNSFQAKMCKAISNYNSTLWRDKVAYRKIESLFHPDKTYEIMAEWNRQGQPDLILVLNQFFNFYDYPPQDRESNPLNNAIDDVYDKAGAGDNQERK